MGGKQSKSRAGKPQGGGHARAGAADVGGQGMAPPRLTPSETHTYHRSSTSQFQNKYGLIPDNFSSVQQVQEKLREVGLESSNLIVGVDFTKSNEWTGRRSFGGRCLHSVGPEPNPYEQAISIIGEALSPFDEDNLIPCFGFGDVTTHDKAVFSFYPGSQPCHGFGDVLARYRSIVPYIKLSGPTSFAPIVEAAVRTVEESGGQYHVLLIIADGQVTRSEDLSPTEMSEQERASVQAIGAASNYPLSIVLVGVGDGPWHMMKAFDNAIPQRNFDNFQFVDFTGVMAGPGSRDQLAAAFALMALMEVPFQYKACAELDLLGQRVGRIPPNAPLPPPPPVLDADQRAALAEAASFAVPPSKGGMQSSLEECPICLLNSKNTAFQCGHQACEGCSKQVSECPICRAPVSMRIKLYA